MKIKEYLIYRLVPDYEDIKKENQSLKEDMYNIIVKQDPITLLRWKMKYQLDRVIWFGNA